MKFMHAILPLTLFLHACGGGSSSDSPTVPPPPTNPTAGTVLEEACNGTTLVQTIADGNGGSTEEQQENSEKCGYEPPPAFGTPVGDHYCSSTLAQDRFTELMDSINHFRTSDKLQDYADGEGGTYTERVDHLSQDCIKQFEQMKKDLEQNKTNTIIIDDDYHEEEDKEEKSEYEGSGHLTVSHWTTSHTNCSAQVS